jgi:predicted glutamine amidotransferase
MCRMIAAPLGIPGSLLIDPLLRMARGENATNEHNTERGAWIHRNGWGGAFEAEGSVRIHRSIEACWEDADLASLASKRTFLLHARRASAGSVSIEDTHPFDARIGDDLWVFCHNGTVRDSLPPSGAEAGNTDSERIFRRLTPYVREERILDGLREVYSGFHDFTSLNSFLLGRHDFWAVCLFSRDPTYYTLSLAVGERGPIVSSEPLAEFSNGRRPIPNGSALHIDRRSGVTRFHELGIANF